MMFKSHSYIVVSLAVAYGKFKPRNCDGRFSSSLFDTHNYYACFHLAFEDDYEFSENSDPTTTTITFLAGQSSNSICVDVRLLDDVATEYNEMFSVVITPIDTSDAVGIGMATVTIIDNDGKSGIFYF